MEITPISMSLRDQHRAIWLWTGTGRQHIDLLGEGRGSDILVSVRNLHNDSDNIPGPGYIRAPRQAG